MKERVESERHDALLTVGKHYGLTWFSRSASATIAMQLFQRLKSVHRLPPEYADWLEAAAMLHEVGAFINRSGRRRHTYYIIANSELFGYTPVQRRIIAAIARYVGNSLPAARATPVMKLVPRPDQARCPRRSRCLRLARALDQARRGAVRELHVRIQQDGPVRLTLTPASSEGVELELWAVDQETELLQVRLRTRPLRRRCAEFSARPWACMSHRSTAGLRSSFSTLATPPFFISTAASGAPLESTRFTNSVMLGSCPTTMIAALSLWRFSNALNCSKSLRDAVRRRVPASPRGPSPAPRCRRSASPASADWK